MMENFFYYRSFYRVYYFTAIFLILGKAQVAAFTTTTTITKKRCQPLSAYGIIRNIEFRPSLESSRRPSFRVGNKCTGTDSVVHQHYYHELGSLPMPSPSSLSLSSNTQLSSTAAAELHSNGFVLSIILWLSTIGTTLERRTTIGKALSAPLVTMTIALIVANVGVIPFKSSIYTMINKYLVPLAVPLLLFDSDLKRVLNDTGTLLIAFCVGAVSTVIGTILAFPIIPLKSLGADVGWRVACALAARHVGGAINFVAVAETLSINGDAVAAASKFSYHEKNQREIVRFT